MEEIQEQVVDEITEQQIPEQSVDAEVNQGEQSQEAPAETDKYQDNQYEDNVKALREAKEEQRRRAELAEQERDQIIKYLESQQKAAQPQDDFGIREDDYVEGKDLIKVSKTVKQYKQEADHYRAQSEEMLAELKLNNEFKDFNQVVTSDNVQSLIKKYPELKSSIVNNDPLYTRGKSTYRLIKKFMGDDIQTPDNTIKKAKIKKNMGKPRPASSVKESSTSPLSQANMFANGYTKEVGDALEKEMYEAIDRY